MGCTSGKASSLQPLAKAASPDGTLLGAQSSPKNASANVSEQEISAQPVTMIVKDWHKLYSTHQGLARALKVYDAGWVAGFNDVKNGDTGTLLAEGHADAVAIRIHRNGGVVCMACTGVELAGFNGVWSGGEIRGEFLTWHDGNLSQLKVEGAKITVSKRLATLETPAEHRGRTSAIYTADLTDDDKIFWDDGSVWHRHWGPPPLPQSADAAAVHKGPETAVREGPANRPEMAIHDARPEAEAPVYSNRIQTVEDVVPTAAPVITDNVVDSSRGAGNSLSSAALFPSVGPPLYGNKARKERTMCCC